MNLGVLASHEGTTLQSLLDAFAVGRIPGRVSVVVSNNGDSGALVKAREAGVQAVHLSSSTHRDPAALDAAIRDVLIEPRLYCGSAQAFARDRRARLVQVLDLFAEDSWRNVYAGDLELRPPRAPTNRGGYRGARPLSPPLFSARFRGTRPSGSGAGHSWVHFLARLS